MCCPPRRGGVRAAQQQAGPFLRDSVLARQEIPPDQPEHAAARLRPPQHGGLLRPSYFCRYVCVYMLVGFKTRKSRKSHVTSNASAAPPGPDTKLMQNSGRTKFKRTSIDRLMNTLVLWVGCPKLLTFSHYFWTPCQRFGFHFVYLAQQVYHILVLLSATMQLWGVWM